MFMITLHSPWLELRSTFFVLQVAMSNPAAVAACNLDLENLITDVNRSIATLAITTLLKTGAESSVDRLMKQIATFVSEISDEFKVSKCKNTSNQRVQMFHFSLFACS
jgi:coatomer protein complex subunit gamma